MSEELLHKLKIDTSLSLYNLIEHYSHTIRQANNPKEKANIILAKFDVNPIDNEDIARITAVALIVELATEGRLFVLKKGLERAQKSIKSTFRLHGRTIPSLLDNKKSSKVQKDSIEDEQDARSKKALEIYRKYHKEKVKVCTEKIAKALKITYNSAYYYHRKFSKI